ncbi:hypothetical protein ACVH36_22705, partial [Klebsiella pneumoniae]
RHRSVRLVICFDLAIDQIAQFGLSSLKVIYYSAQLFSIECYQAACGDQCCDNTFIHLKIPCFISR